MIVYISTIHAAVLMTEALRMFQNTNGSSTSRKHTSLMFSLALCHIYGYPDSYNMTFLLENRFSFVSRLWRVQLFLLTLARNQTPEAQMKISNVYQITDFGYSLKNTHMLERWEWMSSVWKLEENQTWINWIESEQWEESKRGIKTGLVFCTLH